MPVAGGFRCRYAGSGRLPGGGVCREAGAHRGEERGGEHGQDGVAVPGPPQADLVFVQAGFGLGDGEGFLDSPAAAGDLDQFAQGGPEPVVAHEVGVLLITCVTTCGGDPVTRAARASLAVLVGFAVLAGFVGLVVRAAAVLGCASSSSVSINRSAIFGRFGAT